MAKKDTTIHLDIRSTEEGGTPEKERSDEQGKKSSGEGERTVVKNANAAGLGAMERSDQSMGAEDESLNRY